MTGYTKDSSTIRLNARMVNDYEVIKMVSRVIAFFDLAKAPQQEIAKVLQIDRRTLYAYRKFLVPSIIKEKLEMMQELILKPDLMPWISREGFAEASAHMLKRLADYEDGQEVMI